MKRKRLAALVGSLAVVGAGALGLALVSAHTEAAAPARVAAATPAAADSGFADRESTSPTYTATGDMMSEAEAIRAAAGDRSVTEPTRAELLPIREAETVFETGVVDLVPADTMVWVITVHSPMTTMGSPLTLPKTYPVYSMAINAKTREGYGTGIGVDSLG